MIKITVKILKLELIINSKKLNSEFHCFSFVIEIQKRKTIIITVFGVCLQNKYIILASKNGLMKNIDIMLIRDFIKSIKKVLYRKYLLGTSGRLYLNMKTLDPNSHYHVIILK